MRVPAVLRGDLALTHLCERRLGPIFFPSHFALPTTPALSRTSTRMVSDITSPEWTAQRVRETFLAFFQQNGHTFGRLHHATFMLLIEPSPLYFNLTNSSYY